MTKSQWNKLKIGDAVFRLSHDKEFNKTCIKGTVLRFAFGGNQAEIGFQIENSPVSKIWSGRLSLEIEESKILL